MTCGSPGPLPPVRRRPATDLGPEGLPRRARGVSLSFDSTPRRPMAPISALRANANATIEATITAISTPRDVTTSRGPSRVADATLQDETGTVSLTLWGGDIEKYAVGQKIRITDGWVKDYRGKLQVSMGRSGRIEIVR